MSTESTTTTAPAEDARHERVRKIGTVVSDKMEKSITVVVERRVRHPKYHKFISRRSKFMAHDERGEAGIGDLVEIVETRPMSARKRWRLVRVIEKAR
jgi:small subunit ribosomal protein S17